VYVQFLPVVDGEGKEKELLTNVMKKVLAENDFSGLDVNKVKNVTVISSFALFQFLVMIFSFRLSYSNRCCSGLFSL